MKLNKFPLVLVLLLTFTGVKAGSNDSLILAQAYINLSLTVTYFDTLSPSRISKILPFETMELASIKDPDFISDNDRLYNFTHALLYYNKARLLFRLRTNPDRSALISWKNTLEKAIDYFNLCHIDTYDKLGTGHNSFYEFVKFDGGSCDALYEQILSLKKQLNPYFNQDVYPDFKRLFYLYSKSDELVFDSLTFYAGIFNMPVSRDVLDNAKVKEHHYVPEPELMAVSNIYELAMPLDLVSRFLQFNYLSRNGAGINLKGFDKYNLYDAYRVFIYDLNAESPSSFGWSFGVSADQLAKDDFIRNEMSKSVTTTLYKAMQKKYKYDYVQKYGDAVVGLGGPNSPEKVKYYFPVPAPYPSAIASVNKFQPGLKTMGEVDRYIKRLMKDAGYDGRLHYYYVDSGFAITTSLEKVNKDGSRLSDNQRWDLSVGGEGKFSLYDILKTMFLATDGNYRIIALIVAPKEIERRKSKPSFSEMGDLIKNSYASLPPDLENFVLREKTLTVLLYNFYQSDIGEVPMLDASQRYTIKEHLKGSTLVTLITD